MNIKKLALASAVSAAMTALAAGASLANSQIASLVVTNGNSADFTFSGGIGGVLRRWGRRPRASRLHGRANVRWPSRRSSLWTGDR